MDIKEYVRQVEARRVVTQPKIHKVCCTNCPSANYPSDPETEDILTWPREQQKDTVFACGWNQKRYCKGYCDVLKNHRTRDHRNTYQKAEQCIEHLTQ